MEIYKLGRLEFAFELTEADTGEKKTVVSTPSMWAIANEYQDSLIAEGGHTGSWVMAKYLNVLVMLAAARAGLIAEPKGVPSLEEQAEFMNRYSCEDVSAQYKKAASDDDDAEDPIDIDQEGDQAAE